MNITLNFFIQDQLIKGPVSPKLLFYYKKNNSNMAVLPRSSFKRNMRIKYLYYRN